ncbi:hypothetical protein QTP88_014303 [Uroleucon formosanum]
MGFYKFGKKLQTISVPAHITLHMVIPSALTRVRGQEDPWYWGPDFRMTRHKENPAKKPILIQNISKEDIGESQIDCEHENDFLTNKTDIHDLFDPGLWPEHINDDNRQKIITANPSNFDNILKMRKTISRNCNGKMFSEFLLYTKSSNNRETYPRDWLIYTSKKTLLCFVCLLFSENLTESIKSRSRGPDLNLYPGLAIPIIFDHGGGLFITVLGILKSLQKYSRRGERIKRAPKHVEDFIV